MLQWNAWFELDRDITYYAYVMKLDVLSEALFFLNDVIRFRAILSAISKSLTLTLVEIRDDTFQNEHEKDPKTIDRSTRSKFESNQ